MELNWSNVSNEELRAILASINTELTARDNAMQLTKRLMICVMSIPMPVGWSSLKMIMEIGQSEICLRILKLMQMTLFYKELIQCQY